MKNTFKTISIGLLLLAGSTSVFAENRTEAITVSPFVGSYVLPSNQNLNSRPILGLRAGYNFNENLTAETVVNYGLGRNSNARESNSTRYGVDVLYHFLLPEHMNKYVPFVAMGGGGNYLTTPDTSGTPSIASKNYATFNVGGGLKYFMTEDIALRGDIRQVTSFESSTRMNVEYTAGVTFNFGGVRKPTPPVPACAAAETKTVIVERVVEKIVEVPKIVEKIVEVPKVVERIIEKPVTVYVEKKTVVRVPVEPKPVHMDNMAVKTFEALALEQKLEALHGGNFALNGVTLTASGKTALAQNAALLMRYPNAKILVAGFASRSGTPEHNQKLSEKRAIYVRNLLVEAGINKNNITTVGYGSTQAFDEQNPHDINSPKAIANRRVVIAVSGI